MSDSGWIPELVYEEADESGMASSIPMIYVPTGEVMPPVLFVFESRATGEFEPGVDGSEVPVVQMDLHQYASMSILKEKLGPELYDAIRLVLGLRPLREAVESGHKISQRIQNNLRPTPDLSE